MFITFRSCPPGYSYTAPYTYDVSEKLAKKFIADGVASISTPVLPNDFPARNKLIEAGIETVDDIKTNLMDIKEIVDDSEMIAIKKAIK